MCNVSDENHADPLVSSKEVYIIFVGSFYDDDDDDFMPI
jgi:hypothetical protein